MASAPTTFDPLRGGPGDAEVAALVYDTPFVVDADGKPRPSLALALDNPDGALRARLDLRPEVRFSDGTPLTARDVAASLTRALHDPAGWTLAPIKTARAVGDRVVELELSRPTPELALLLSTPAAAVTPGGAAPGKRPIGSGPFVVDGSDVAERAALGQRRLLRRPRLSAVAARCAPSPRAATRRAATRSARSRWRAIRWPRSMPTGPRRAAVTVDGPQALTGFVAVGRIADADVVRRVLALAINRERLRRLTVREPRCPCVKARLRSRRAPRAKSSAAGRRARPKLALLVDASRFDNRDVAERILADLARAGIELSIDAVDAATYQARADAGRYELLLGTAAPPAPDGGAGGAGARRRRRSRRRARRALARAPAVDLETTRVVPLYVAPRACTPPPSCAISPSTAPAAPTGPTLTGCLALDGAGA